MSICWGPGELDIIKKWFSNAVLLWKHIVNFSLNYRTINSQIQTISLVNLISLESKPIKITLQRCLGTYQIGSNLCICKCVWRVLYLIIIFQIQLSNFVLLGLNKTTKYCLLYGNTSQHRWIQFGQDNIMWQILHAAGGWLMLRSEACHTTPRCLVTQTKFNCILNLFYHS